MSIVLTLLLGSILIASSGTAQQACPQVEDINTLGAAESSNPTPARKGPGGVLAMTYLRCGNHWFFRATTPNEGDELWKTDGTPFGTVLVKDINPGLRGSSINYLVCANNQVYFCADDGSTGLELWRSDGTTVGTTLVFDIEPGIDSSKPMHLEAMGGKVYFSAEDQIFGRELWCSDGTAIGTIHVKDINIGADDSSPVALIADTGSNSVYFSADDGRSGPELWKTDGSISGTQLVKDIYPGQQGSSIRQMVQLGSTIIFSANHPTYGVELWKTDGSTTGTTLIADIHPSGSSAPILATSEILGSALYFAASNGSTGIELWQTDGTAVGTILAADINPGPASSTPLFLHRNGSSLFFAATGSTSKGRELWRHTNGVSYMVKDISPGSGSSSPFGFSSLGNKVVFTANDPGAGYELYVTDGSSSGTIRIKDIEPGPQGGLPYWITPISRNKILFNSSDGDQEHGKELWETDGTATGTQLFRDLSPRFTTISSSPSHLVSVNGKTLLFAADDGQHGTELWKTDDSGTNLVIDLNRGAASSHPSGFYPFWNGSKTITLFQATNGHSGSELWKTDGTSAGTQLVMDIRPGAISSSPRQMASCGEWVLFTADDGIHGKELWLTNGLTTGLVRDLKLGSGSSDPQSLTSSNGRVFFSATTTSSGRELYVTDGTSAGTALVKDINPGSSNSSPSNLVSFSDYYDVDRIVFTASGGVYGTELWISDGTATGTYLLHDTYPGPSSGSPDQLTIADGNLYFVSNNGINGRELWYSDLTNFGTRMIRDINNGASGSSPLNLYWTRSKLFFSATDSSSSSSAVGRELFVSDGTYPGTQIVADINPGPGGSSPQYLIAAGAGIYFAANGVETGDVELYFSDGSASGTYQVCEISPGSNGSDPKSLTASGGNLYMTANSPATGMELHVISGSPATVEILGNGCGKPQPTLKSTPPVIGQSQKLSGLTGSSTGAHLLLIGLLGEPRYIPGLVAPGCSIWEDLSVPGFIVTPHPPGPRWSLPLAIPNDPALIGSQLAVQGAYSSLPLSLSNGLLLKIGH